MAKILRVKVVRRYDQLKASNEEVYQAVKKSKDNNYYLLLLENGLGWTLGETEAKHILGGGMKEWVGRKVYNVPGSRLEFLSQAPLKEIYG